jgi:hypothetical protein
MDGEGFDRLTRGLATGATRRRFLAAAGALLTGLGAHSAAAARKCNGAGGVCGSRKGGRECCAGATCLNGKCCQAEHICGDQCIDPESDPANCGGCGSVCTTGVANAVPVCQSGVCGSACAAGYKPCNGACIPVDGCCTHADCDDGNGCTVDICGPTSHTCGHVGFGSDCLQCSSAGDCGGGPCCGGRCCSPTAVCTDNGQGYPVCEEHCSDTAVCIDHVSVPAPVCYDGVCAIGYYVGTARCTYGTGVCASCPAICTSVGSVDYAVESPGSGTCGEDNVCVARGVAPVGQWV